MQMPEPLVPDAMHPLAREILERLRSVPEAGAVVLGGGVALQHYCHFRPTRDIDAWWETAPRRDTHLAIERGMNEIARLHGLSVRVRAWGETDSYELLQEGRTLFSFQIATRTKALDPPMASDWEPVKIETFRDNLASKINAAVLRGAPRDFLDLFEVCRRGLATAEECWQLWHAKNPEKDIRSGQANLIRHLERLQSRRPLTTIADPVERDHAERVRLWLRETLCRES